MQVHIVHEHIPKLFTFPSPNPWPIYSPRQFYFHFYVRLTDMRSAYSWRGFCFPSSYQGVHDWCCVGFFMPPVHFPALFIFSFSSLRLFDNLPLSLEWISFSYSGYLLCQFTWRQLLVYPLTTTVLVGILIIKTEHWELKRFLSGCITVYNSSPLVTKHTSSSQVAGKMSIHISNKQTAYRKIINLLFNIFFLKLLLLINIKDLTFSQLKKIKIH